MGKVLYHGSDHIIERPEYGKVLNLNAPPYHILNWLAVLAENRTYWQNGSIAQEAKQYLKEQFLIDISGYRSTKKRASYLDELFIIDIMREGMQNDDPRLR